VLDTTAAYRDAVVDDPDFYQSVVNGLTSSPKTLPCKYFYDEKGSYLFDQICQTPEYYVTRTETALLRKILPEIAAIIDPGSDILEFGSGAGQKIRLLLDGLRNPASYTPMDISESALLESVVGLRADYPDINIRPWVGDYTIDLINNLENLSHLNQRVVFFPGSTISNFRPEEAKCFLERVSAWLGENGVLLIGVDTIKSELILNSAYNDAAGVTADFNLNLLHRIKNELGIEIDPNDFEHQAFFNPDQSRVEMHLVARRAHSVLLDGQSVYFEQDESIHTENSYKYSLESFQLLAESAGFSTKKSWLDDRKLFSFHCLHSAPR